MNRDSRSLRMASETILWMTMDEPKVGQIINVDGVRYRILGGNWTGTVAKLEVERVESTMEEAADGAR